MGWVVVRAKGNELGGGRRTRRVEQRFVLRPVPNAV